jgi:hypothetical protein
MARDKKASFKFTTVASYASGKLKQTAATDKLSTSIDYTGYAASTEVFGASDVFSSPNMILAAAADFTAQADTAASGATDLVGINAQNQDLFVKVIYTTAGTLTNVGTIDLKVVASAASTVGAKGNLSSSPVEISATRVVNKTAGTYVVYLPVMSSKPYWQLQVTSTTGGTTGDTGTVAISMAALVNARDGSVSL